MIKICSFIAAGALLLAGCSEKEKQQPKANSVKDWVPLVKTTAAENSLHVPNLADEGTVGSSISDDKSRSQGSPEYLVTVTRNWDAKSLHVQGQIVPTQITTFSRRKGYSEITEQSGTRLTFSITQSGDDVVGELAGIGFQLPKANRTTGLFFHGNVGQTENRNVMALGQRVGSVTVKYNGFTEHGHKYLVSLKMEAPYDSFNTDTAYYFDSEGTGSRMETVGTHEGVLILSIATRK